jgi:hypothetical protein
LIFELNFHLIFRLIVHGPASVRDGSHLKHRSPAMVPGRKIFLFLLSSAWVAEAPLFPAMSYLHYEQIVLRRCDIFRHRAA